MDIFSKLSFESDFEKISLGGAISYVQISKIDQNLNILEDIVKFIYENMQYVKFDAEYSCIE